MGAGALAVIAVSILLYAGNEGLAWGRRESHKHGGISGHQMLSVSIRDMDCSSSTPTKLELS